MFHVRNFVRTRLHTAFCTALGSKSFREYKLLWVRNRLRFLKHVSISYKISDLEITLD